MNIAVYCGSSQSTKKEYEEIAVEVGKWIGEGNHTLVYGGGEAGLMGIVSEAAFNSGAKVIGVVPQNISFISERPQPYVTELIKTADMSERKKKMLEMADVYIALPGGIGTLDEISEAITMVRIGVYNKPCIFMNALGFYEPLRTLIANMADAGYVESPDLNNVYFAKDTYEVNKHVVNHNFSGGIFSE